MKKLLLVFTAMMLIQNSALAIVSAKKYRGRTNGFKLTRHYPEKMENIMFQYDFLTPKRLKEFDLKHDSNFAEDFSKTRVSVLITPHEKPFNAARYNDAAAGGIAMLIANGVVHTRAKFNPEDENFYDVAIIDKETNDLVCKPTKVEKLKMDQDFVDRFDDIVDRGDFEVEKYNEDTLYAVAEFSRDCFAIDKKRKLRIKIEAIGEKSVHTGNHQRYLTVDTISKKLLKQISKDFSNK